MDTSNSWYANKGNDLVSLLQPAQDPLAMSGMNSGAPNTPGAPTVPDLTGAATTPIASNATGPKTSAPDLTPAASTQPLAQKSQAELMEEQRREQEKQRLAQELDQAKKASLSASGFGSQQAGGAVPQTTTQSTFPQGGMQLAGMQTGMQGGAGSRDDDQNRQEAKQQFLREQRSTMDTDYSPSVKKTPRSPYEVKAGAVIPAVMIGGINSDLPGQVIAQVKENVYDSKTGQHLLIPQGSRLIGLYDSSVTYGQERVLLAWNRVIFPNGDSFNLQGMPGADKGGYAGFFDEVDNRYFKIFGNAILMSIISAGVQISQPNNGGNGNNSNQGPSVSQTVGAALGQQIGQTALTITQKNLNIQPTLKIRPGYEFNVMVTADMILPPSN
ncbi:MAG: hypothetical protein CTY12_02040 [Methylotenera sp.]|nr:MAG: hypothetical protein CTY12_02040 [Methylotenera sp.]